MSTTTDDQIFEIIYYDNYSLGVETNFTTPLWIDDDDVDTILKRQVYLYAVPALIVACFVSMVFNLIVLYSVRWIRKSLTPTLCFSLSLSVANAYAGLTVGLGILINSYLPVVYAIPPAYCVSLLVEAFRLTGLIVSALHLLALSINHFIGIFKPLHYAAIMTKRAVFMSIVLMWIFPLLFFLVYFYLFGYVSMGYICSNNFMVLAPFRMTLSFMFLIPLCFMIVFYVKIFFVVQRHQQALRTAASPSRDGSINSGSTGCITLHKNVKAVFTTLLILGTYLLGWGPAVVFFMLTCETCPIPLLKISIRIRLIFSIVSNSLIILKNFIDPVIYVVRMPDVQGAFRHMWQTRCGLRGDSRNGQYLTSRRYSVTSNTETLHLASVTNGYRRKNGAYVSVKTYVSKCNSDVPHATNIVNNHGSTRNR